jgi:hypothetical protein
VRWPRTTHATRDPDEVVWYSATRLRRGPSARDSLRITIESFGGAPRACAVSAGLLERGAEQRLIRARLRHPGGITNAATDEVLRSRSGVAPAGRIGLAFWYRS